MDHPFWVGLRHLCCEGGEKGRIPKALNATKSGIKGKKILTNVKELRRNQRRDILTEKAINLSI